MQKTLKVNKLKYQSGQAMIEFALVLPLLIVLTVGTIFLTITYIHQSTMNGVSFMSARALAVRNNTQVAQQVQNRFKKRAKFNNPNHWLNQVTIKARRVGSQAEVTLSKPAEQLDMLANFINSVGNGNTKHDPRIQQSKITLSDEYINRQGSSRPQTFKIVNYRYGSTGGDGWNKLLPEEIKQRLPIDLRQIAMKTETASQEQKDAVLGALPYDKRLQQGLEPRLKDFYKDSGMAGGDGLNNSEKVSGKSPNLHNASNFNTIKKIHSHFRKIQIGAGAMQIFIDTLLLEVPGASDIIYKIGKGIGEGAEKVMNGIEASLETHKLLTFKNGVLN